MATVSLLDTHVVVWLYDKPQHLPFAVQQRVDADDLAVSPFVRLKLRYLYEIGRIAVSEQEILDELVPKLEITLTNPPAAAICEAATKLSWTRDPFDRLISAEAVANSRTLITKDNTIRKNLPPAWWEDS